MSSFLLHAGPAQPVLDRVDDRADLPLDAVDLSLVADLVPVSRCIRPIEFAVILGGKLFDEFGSHQVVFSPDRTLASRTSHRTVKRLSQVPRLRAFEQP
jgi:hypothetical protein